MNYLFLEYPKCSTCQKAKKWLEENEIPFEDRHIVEQNPTAEELRQWTRAAGFPLKKLFNTSGLLYRSMGLKEKLPQLTEEEQLNLLASNGMLVKRPLVIGEQILLAGFRPESWEQLKVPVILKEDE